MLRLAAGVSYCDLQFQSRPRIVAAALLHGAGGAAIVDPGPSSTLPVLHAALAAAGLSMRRRDGAAAHAYPPGSRRRDRFARSREPRLRVYVHERGAPHMVDPSKLVASASLLYGDAMERLWGEVSPVPASALTVLEGGERIEEGGRQLEVAYTPGHASHHVSYFNADTGIAFVGDTAGIKIVENGYRPAADAAARHRPRGLGRAACARSKRGGRTPCSSRTSDRTAAPVRTSPNCETIWRSPPTSSRRRWRATGSDGDREVWFSEELRKELRRRLGDAEGRSYEVAGRLDLSWRGLARYWRKRVGSQ